MIVAGLPTRFFDSDAGVNLSFTLVTPDGVTPVDLTTSTVTLRVENLAASPIGGFVLDSPTTGVCHVIIPGGVFTPGTYRAQVRVFYGSSADFHSDVFLLNCAKGI